MRYDYFIAKKIISGKSKGKISAPVIRIAVIGVALGLCVMVLAISIVTGFQHDIREKIIGFSGNITISSFDANSSFERKPILADNPELTSALLSVPGIKHYHSFATKAGIIKTEKNIEGIVLKGVGKEYDWSFFDRHIVAGKSFRA